MNGILAGERVVKSRGRDGSMLCASGLAGVMWSTGSRRKKQMRADGWVLVK